jgi:predicted CopG family antitoxin
MKQINVYFEDEEYEKLIKKKNGLTWRDFILELLKNEVVING